MYFFQIFEKESKLLAVLGNVFPVQLIIKALAPSLPKDFWKHKNPAGN